MSLALLNPVVHVATWREWIRLVGRHRQLALELARRDISSRYAGQILGAGWAIGHPILLMGVYVFVFGLVFKVRIGGTLELPLGYPAYLLAGLIPWLAFQEVLARAPTVLVTEASLVKQVVFPIEILPLRSVLSALVTQGAATIVLVAYVLGTERSLPWTYALLPALVVVQAVAMLGVSYLLAAVGAYFRDLKDVLQVLATVGLYLMPILYLPAWVPAAFKPLLYVNPFSYFVWAYQDACYFGRFEHWWAWVVLPVLAGLAFGGGYRLFRRVKPLVGNFL